jgi:hypothetical protein
MAGAGIERGASICLRTVGQAQFVIRIALSAKNLTSGGVETWIHFWTGWDKKYVEKIYN